MENEYSGQLQRLIRMITARGKEAERILVTIDGPCASGKTTLAGRLAEALQASVVHTDEYVVPHAQKTAERLAIPGGNCDAGRLVREVVTPWKNGSRVVYTPYDCKADRMMPEAVIDGDGVLILEGSYCNLPMIREHADVRLFVTVPWEVRESRLKQRESAESLQRFYERWIPLEDAYFAACHLPDEGCAVIDGTAF